MGFLRRRHEEPDASARAAAPASAPVDLPWTHRSDFIKQVTCVRCGAPKSLPSKTAYLYCDHCAALIDYDFRLANADTNRPLTNLTYTRLMAERGAELAVARAAADRDTYATIQAQVFARWIDLCPMAVSPRARNDGDFRARMVQYLAETITSKDLDPRQAPLDEQIMRQGRAVQRVAAPDGVFVVAETLWPVATTFRQQMEMAYERIHQLGLDALDPDDSPPGVPISMEYSTFCQSWLPSLRPADGQRLLDEFGLTGSYTQLRPQATAARSCGGCGSQLATLPGARVVLCEDCGRRIDVGSAEAPCRNCGAPLSFPEGAGRIDCPYCSTETARV